MSSFILDRKIGDVKTWEVYMGFILIQLIIGILVFLIVSIFDYTGIHGALSQIVRQFGIITAGQSPTNYIDPIYAEIKEGKYI
jgi:hypothetical protein